MSKFEVLNSVIKKRFITKSTSDYEAFSSYFVSDVLSHSFPLFLHLAMFLFSLLLLLSSRFSDCRIHFRIILVVQSALNCTYSWRTFYTSKISK